MQVTGTAFAVQNDKEEKVSLEFAYLHHKNLTKIACKDAYNDHTKYK